MKLQRLESAGLRATLNGGAAALLVVCLGCSHHVGSTTEEATVGPVEAQSDGSLARIRRRGELRIGVSPAAPYTIPGGMHGYQGFDVDLAERLAEDLGVKLVLVDTPLCSLTRDLQDAKYDAVLSGFTITPERALFVSFSNPVAEVPFLLVEHVPQGKKQPADDMDAFNRSEMKIGAVESTVAEAVARERFPRSTLQSFDRYGALLSKVESGELDAIVLPSPVAHAAVGASRGALRLVDGPALSSRPEAVAVRKRDRDLHDYLNSWLAFYQSSGWIAERYHHWFDRLDWAADLAKK